MAQASEHPIATIWRWIGLIQHGILRVFGLMLIFIVLVSIPGCIAGMTMGGDRFTLADNGVLTLRLEGRIVEEKTRVSPEDAFSQALLGAAPEDEILLDDLVEGLRFAAADEDVTAILLDFDGFGGGTSAALYRVAQELRAFRDSGKTLIAHRDFYSLGNYVLAAQASELTMHPLLSAVDVTGFTSYRPYFAELLETLRVTVNVFRVGTFKSAVEPFLLEEASPEAEAALQFVFDDIWDSYKAEAAAGRSVEPALFQRYGDTLPDLVEAANGDSGRVALDLGLVDSLQSRAAHLEDLRERFGDEDGDIETSSFFAYLRDARETAPDADADAKIAVINFVGGIIDGEGDGGVIGGDDHARLVREARLDDDVKAIVMRIDSGGGSALASELIREELAQAREDGLVVIASMGGVAASGGYWIATPAQEIWAHPTTITGSIGIFGLIPTFENTLDWAGINFDGITTTESGDDLLVTEGVSEDGARTYQAVIEQGYREFLQRVADSRGMSIDEVDAVAQGRIWTGSQALERNLVDSLGTFEQAVARAAELAGLEEGAYEVDVVEDEYDPFEAFLKELGLETAVALGGEGLFGGVFARPAAEFQSVSLLNDPRGVYAVCLACEGLDTVR